MQVIWCKTWKKQLRRLLQPRKLTEWRYFSVPLL